MRQVKLRILVAGWVWVAALSSLGAAAESPEPAKRLAGKWETVDRSSGGLGTILEFMPDGSAAMSPGAMVDSEYRLEGNQLVITFPGLEESEMAKLQKFEVRIEGNRLIQKELTLGTEARLERVGTAPLGESSIVGVWKEDSARQGNSDLPPEWQAAAAIMGRNARTIFTRDGRMLLRIPFTTTLGTYSVDGNKLSMKFGPQEGTGRIEGDSLLISFGGISDELKLKRADW